MNKNLNKIFKEECEKYGLLYKMNDIVKAYKKEIKQEEQLTFYIEKRKNMNEYINLTLENIEKEHICCAIGDPKHQVGVNNKKNGLKVS